MESDVRRRRGRLRLAAARGAGGQHPRLDHLGGDGPRRRADRGISLEVERGRGQAQRLDERPPAARRSLPHPGRSSMLIARRTVIGLTS